MFKIIQVSTDYIRGKNKKVSINSKMSNLPRNGKKNCRKMAGFGGSSGSAVVSYKNSKV